MAGYLDDAARNVYSIHSGILSKYFLVRVTVVYASSPKSGT